MTKTEIREALTAAGLKAATISTGKARFQIRMGTHADAVLAARVLAGAALASDSPREDYLYVAR